MKRTLLLIPIIISISLLLNAGNNSNDFNNRFWSEVDSRSSAPIRDEIKSEVQKRQIVFISGILSEMVSPYYEPNNRIIKDVYGGGTVPVIKVGSNHPLKHCRDKLYEKILKIYEETNKPIVLIAHSKGAVVMTLMLFKYPELIEKGIIEKAISMQGAFSGSPVADLLLSNEDSHWLKKLLTTTLKPILPGIKSLSTFETKRAIREGLENLTDHEYDLIDNSLIYIRATQKPRKTVFYLRVTNHYLQKFGISDGIILTKDQLIPGLGRDLGIIFDIDHIDLVMDRPLSNSLHILRKSFMKLLFRIIFLER